jgi:hypothetical protein
LTDQILTFLQSIGLPTRIGEISVPTFFPGVLIEAGVVVVDPAKLKEPGDILHEAGHLAMMEPARRAATTGDAGSSGGEELGATAWSYAAVIHMGVDPRVIFHPTSYAGGGDSMVENFAAGHYIGVPLLQWMGLTADEKRARELGFPPYPYMLRWLRE